MPTRLRSSPSSWRPSSTGPTSSPRTSPSASSSRASITAVIRDNDRIYGAEFVRRVNNLDLEQVTTALRSPWQNDFAERWIGSLRRACLDHVIALNERQLHAVIRRHITYYHDDRTHLGLDKDTPRRREFEPRQEGKVIALPCVGGLPHRYVRKPHRAA